MIVGLAGAGGGVKIGHTMAVNGLFDIAGRRGMHLNMGEFNSPNDILVVDPIEPV